MSRIADPAPESLTEEQRQVCDDIVAGRRGAVRGAYRVLVRSPKLAGPAQRLGTWLRYESAIPLDLAEYAIMLVARHWANDYEWTIHARHAAEDGLDAAIIDATKAGGRPDFGARADAAAVYDLCVALLETGHVPDAAFDAAVTALGREAVIDLVAMTGYQCLIMATLNAFDVSMEDGTAPFRIRQGGA